MGKALCDKHFKIAASLNPGNSTSKVGKPQFRERAVCLVWRRCENRGLSSVLHCAWAPCLVLATSGTKVLFSSGICGSFVSIGLAV